MGSEEESPLEPDVLNDIGEHFLAGHCRSDSPKPILRYASGLREVYVNAALHIHMDRNFAPASSYVKDCYCFPMYNGLISFSDIRAEEKKRKHNDPTISLVIDQSREYWKTYAAERILKRSLDDKGAAIFAVNDYSKYQCFFSTWQGHATLDYRTILGKGIVDYDRRIGEAIRSLSSDHDEEKQDFLYSISMVMDGILRLIRRNIWELERAPAEKRDGDGSRAWRMREAFERMLVGPPEDFYQALQYVHFLTAVDGFDNVGRMDQYLYPFYVRDRERGSMDEEIAEELLVELFDIWGAHGLWQVVISGQTAEGTDGTNELTYIILRARRRVCRPHPSLSLRLSSRSSDHLLVNALEVLSEGLGHPALYNDDLYVRLLEGIGVPTEDAVEFAFGGCSETHIAGKGAIRDSFVNVAKALEAVLYNGRVSSDGEKLGFETGDPEVFQDFDSFFRAYKRQVEFIIDTFVHYRNLAQQVVANSQPALLRSIFIADCIENGASHSHGGARYTNGMVDVYGIPNVANSLFVIKRLMFEERHVSMGSLIDALRHDFRGYEDLRLLCLRQHKYGNDYDDVDHIARDVADHVFSYIQKHRIWNGGIYYGFCASAPGHHMIFGKTTGATPDGRLAGTPLANSLGPVQGTDGKGPTAMFNSVNKIGLGKAIGTPVVNVSFSKEMFEPEHYGRIISLIRTFFSRGGMQLQLSVVDRETLLDALMHPERHAHLIVRVSGYSARFIDLPREIQHEIAERTVHTAR